MKDKSPTRAVRMSPTRAVRIYLEKPELGFVPMREDGTYERPEITGPITDYIEFTIGHGGVYVRSGEGGISVEPQANNHIHVVRREH